MQESNIKAEEVKALVKRWREDPVYFVRTALNAEPNSDQIKLLDAIPHNKFISVKSGHGVGKTTVESWIIMWFLMCYQNSRIPITAPTEDQLTMILWPEVMKWLEKSKIKEYLEWTKTKIYFKGEEQTAFAVYRTASKPEALQGFHEGNIMFILEEASGVADEIWQPVEGALTTANARAIALGNPTRPEGNFYRSFTDQSEFWKTFTFSCVNSENVDPSYVERMRKKYGENSDVYRVRVLGEFPSQVSDAFIPLYLCEESLLIDKPEYSERPCMGVDVARFGDDYSVWAIRKGGRIIHLEREQTMDLMQIAGKTNRLQKQYQVLPEDIYIDEIGVGSGVVDRLKELNFGCIGVNVGMAADDILEYFNKRVELYGIVRQKLKDKLLNLTIESDKELTQDLCGELASPRYKLTSKGQYQLESKADMKKRGVGSPDIADALVLSYFREIYHGGGIASSGHQIPKDY